MFEPGIEGVPQSVTQEIERQDGEEDGEAGATTMCGKSRMKVRPEASMLPHSGVGGWMPSPMKDRAAMVRMALATYSVTCTMMGPMQLGST